ncbi:MAG TPA: GNAT family N-acetyltransferase [Terracidiphilus sp.]|nr:GNAT family N-acetyltransferase [Terracidiphilus sp.]
MRASLENAGDREALLANPDAVEIPLEQIRDGRVYVAELFGSIAGFSALEWRSDGQAELDALFVEPAMQRRGIGKSLVQHCAEIARLRRATSLHVIGNPHALHFYRACGFESLGVVKTRFGDALSMRMPVSK